MDVERTGYDNVFLIGRLLGLSKQEMKTHLPDIEAFSELSHSFLDMPIRSYSEGMKVRLGMAIVTCLNPDILVLDEAIGAGDAHFIEKATRRAQKPLRARQHHHHGLPRPLDPGAALQQGHLGRFRAALCRRAALKMSCGIITRRRSDAGQVPGRGRQFPICSTRRRAMRRRRAAGIFVIAADRHLYATFY